VSNLHFSDLVIGQELPAVEHLVTQEVIDRAAVAHLDFNPVHTNLEWNERAQIFHTTKPVAHGMFTLSLMTSVIHRPWHGEGARIRSVEAKFTKPVPVGEILTCVGHITELHPVGPGRNSVVVAVTASDSESDVTSVGTFRVSVPD